MILPNIATKLATFAVIYAIALLWASLAALREIFLYLRQPSEYFRVRPRPTPPAALSAEAKYSKKANLSNGISLHYVAKGDSNKPMILFLHGFPEFWYSWRDQLSVLSADYYCVAVDLRGYGESSKPTDIKNYVIDELISDVKLLVSEHFNVKKFTLVGHDWGGLLAWTFADIHRNMLERLIIINCPHPLGIGEQGGLRQALRSWYMFMFQLPLLPELMMRRRDMESLQLMYKNVNGITAADVEAWKYTYGRGKDSFRGPINYYRANMKPVLARLLNLPYFMSLVTKQPVETKVRQWWRSECYEKGEIELIDRNCWQPSNVPTLMIWGVNDKFLDRKFAEVSGEYCTDYRYVLIHDAGHWVPQERPGEVNNLIKEFMENESR